MPKIYCDDSNSGNIRVKMTEGFNFHGFGFSETLELTSIIQGVESEVFR